MKGIITDSHFSTRERMGRLVTFLARIVQDGWASEVHGIGIDETTAVLVEKGKASVVGKGAAYFFTLRNRPEKCVLGPAHGARYECVSSARKRGFSLRFHFMDGHGRVEL